MTRDQESPSSPRLVLLGVGNELLQDEGVGVHIVRRLRAEGLPPGVEAVEAGTAVLDALDLLPTGARVLVVDAASGEVEPGTVYRFGLDDLSADRGASVHEASLPEVFGVARLAGVVLGDVTVLGVKPAVVDLGTELSPPLEGKMPAILRAVRLEIARLLG